MKIIISIDDGSVYDFKVVNILSEYGFKGVFYIAPNYQDHHPLSDKQIKILSETQEIGGHTLNHCMLTLAKEKDAYREIICGKNYLENIIGKKITKFAYPKGWHNDMMHKLVKKAGFTEARTMRQWITDVSGYDKLELPITFHVYPDKLNRFDQMFEAGKIGGYFHLACHSWEIEKFDMWEKFENIIKKLSYENKNT